MVTVLVILLTVAIFLPQVVSAGWHLVHGRTASYRSWRVAVPSGWYAMRHGEGLSVERMSEWPWQKGPEAVFLPVHFTKTYPFQYDLFGKEQANTLSARGYSLTGERNVQVAGKNGRCWTFNNSRNHDQLWIACIVPKDLTSADYQGSKAYADEFFSFLTKTTPNPDLLNSKP